MQPPNSSGSTPKKTVQTPKINYKLLFYQTNQYSLFFYYNYNHPIGPKTNFIYGNIKMFSNDTLYENTINSSHHLNSGFDWNEGFFAKIQENFGNFKIRRKNEEDENDQSLEFCVENEEEEVYEVLIKVSLAQAFGKDIQKQFWSQFANFNEHKNNQIKAKQESNAQLLLKRQEKLEKLIEYQNQCEENKRILLGRLSAVMREKTNKLEEFGEEYDGGLNDEKEMEDEGEPRIMNTLQEEKAFLGSLFEPSQNFYH